MSRYTAPSDYDYDEACGHPVPAHDGRIRIRLLSCTVCDWRGPFADAVGHWRLMQHPVASPRGVVQDFAKFAVTADELLDRR